MRKLSLFSFLLLAPLLAAMITAADVRAESSSYAHFFVVKSDQTNPAQFDEKMGQFKQELAQLAGGYTELGQTSGGAWKEGGLVSGENNISFLAVAPQKMIKEIEALVLKHFPPDKPFVIAWPVERD